MNEIDWKIKNGICPDCDHVLRNESGCMTCPSCGWSACLS